MPRFVKLLTGTMLLVHTPPLYGQDVRAVAAPDQILPLVMTVSGGISRGSYQGGLNWGIVEIARRSSFDTRFRDWVSSVNGQLPVPSLFVAAAGGASAGNINGLLTAIEWCRSAAPTVPEKSLFWQAWVWTGWGQLMWNEHVIRPDEHALFDRRFFADVLKSAVRKQIEPPVKFRPHCRVPVGVTTTRLRADTITVAEEIQASSQRFAIPFVVEVDPKGILRLKQPPLEALNDPTLGEILVLANDRSGSLANDRLDAILRALEASGDYPIAFAFRAQGLNKANDLLRDVVFRVVEASSAFPLAFVPRPLRYSKANDLQLDDVFRAVEASSAFPLAFAPRTLEYNKLSDVLPGALCRSEMVDGWLCDTVRKAQFLDGGVFDNNPLGLAYGLYRCFPFNSSSPERLQRDSTLFCIAPKQRAMLVYMDPDARRLATGSQVRTDIMHGHVDGLSTIPVLIRGAIQTGRQYELAVFGRTVKLIEGAQHLEMQATDRFQAIVGDHFSAFGAFLGRPFREFDFYAGIFDALYFASSEWFCRDSSVPSGTKLRPSEALSASALTCVQRFIGASLCDATFQFGIAARSVMATLFEMEFKKHIVCRDDSLATAISTADHISKSRIIVLNAVAKANEHIRRIASDIKTDDPFLCKRHEFIEEMVCANGFRILLDSLRTKPVRAALDVLSDTKECRAEEHSSEAVEGCHADKTVLDLADDPAKAADDLFAQVLKRLASIPNTKGLERTVEVTEFLFYSGRETNLRTLVPLPSSIPAVRGKGELVGMMLPFQVAIALGNRSFIAGYRPTIYRRNGLQFVFPVEFSNAERHFEQPTGGLRTKGLTTFAMGAGVGWLVGTNWVQNVQATAFWSIRHISAPRSRNLGGELSTVLLFNRLKLGVRVSPSADRGYYTREKVSAIVGLSDVNGLSYWAARLMK